ncbi:MAG: tRNA dihydrouridine synthase DusB [Chlamydiales bacterium]
MQEITPFPQITYAPLAGCSDYSFRQMSARYRPGLMFCEMVKMEPMLRNCPNTYQMLNYNESMRPIGGQICGSQPKLAGLCAKIIEDLGFDVVDLNCGCPVDKVTKDGSGSAMLKDPERIGEAISHMVAAVKIPVTVKIRAGWDEKSINAPLITQIVEEAGARAIFIHGRTRAQAYRGGANWTHIKSSKAVAKKIKVIGNGDIFNADAAIRMLKETHCDGILVSRGTMGQPWIVEDIRHLIKGDPPIDRSYLDYRQALLDHIHYLREHKDPRNALITIRKISGWYLKDAPNVRYLRKAVSQASSLDEAYKLICLFDQ